jgi:hypothetical protein
MAPKRKEAVSPQPAAKRVRDRTAEKTHQQLKVVDAVLKMAPIAPELQQMLTESLPYSLGQLADQRHKYQEQIVNALASILGEVEATHSKELAEARTRHETATAEKPRRDAEFSEATEKMKSQEAELKRLKLALAEKAVVFRAATSSLADAEAVKKADEQKGQVAANKKKDFNIAVQDLTLLKTVSTADAEAGDKGNELMALLKKYKFEESMMIALPAALAKAPEARGQFDMMAISQLEGDIGKMIAEQDAFISEAKPSQEKCEVAVNTAQEQLAKARAEQRAAARSFDIASNDLQMSTAAVAEAQKSVSDLTKMLDRLKKAVYAAEAEVEVFQQGPLDTFKSLRERTTPVVEEPAAIAEEQTTEAHAGDAPVAINVC